MKKLLHVLGFILLFPIVANAAKAGPSSAEAYQNFTFLVTSDIHETDQGTSRKESQLNAMLADVLVPEYNTSAVIFTGDLTDNGNDKEFNFFAQKWIASFALRMPEKSHQGLYLCKGNHDEVSGSGSQILNYLKKEYGDFCYSFDIQGLHFICCSKYPQKTFFGGELNWLKSDLKKLEPQTPVVIFFHYNILGPFSDWWGVSCGSYICTQSKTEKDYFFDAIKDYNIQCIFFGHWHTTYSAMWRNKFRIACVAGDQYAVCQYNPTLKTLGIVFKDAGGILYPWDYPGILQTDLEEL